MGVAVVTGSGGLIGSEAARFLAGRGFTVLGLDNDLRQHFFGNEASTRWAINELETQLGKRYRHHSVDIRDRPAVECIFREHGRGIRLIVHAAAQPSHDWAARDPHTDFSVNATGTLVLLEATRQFAPEAVFVFMSTNKVYGDTPNTLPLVEHATRWEVAPEHRYAAHGIDTTMSIDQSKHSLFGASKAAADLLVQEYGRYFGMKTVCFRGGCLTGPWHSGAEMHGFLSYLVKCTLTGRPYTVYGYKAKQVRDNIHSADVMEAIWRFYQNPKSAAVYNLGGGRYSNCSMLEAIQLAEAATGKKLDWRYSEQARSGDHIWYISDVRPFQADYPGFQLTRTVPQIIEEIARFGIGSNII
jgi:CDP-paratose 2-epimerase